MKVLTKLCLITVAVLVLQVSGLPQRIKRQGTTTTTPSPRYSECIRQCPVTPEYNPVCGSNRVTYDNESKMRCANRCGLSVEKSFGGTCSPL